MADAYTLADLKIPHLTVPDTMKEETAMDYDLIAYKQPDKLRAVLHQESTDTGEPGVRVEIYADSACKVLLRGPYTTDDFGYLRAGGLDVLWLEAGTYYSVRTKPGMVFTNPRSFEVTQ